ncbi:Plasma membrane iron permease [Symbiodinium microadriaticum]|uniref:Plasma membrane iron permease n=1 Tax=Symbiodinium microadriaticum TaxID=2951 RepID=A0A1Q9F3J8_SYMMI|nr:Plasma membrane iron permease [Symbiodinium microadriaticum]
MLRALLVASSLWLSHAMPNTTGKICQWGCYDEEDEACHPGLTNMQCAEIYGHVEWIQVCDCVDEATGLRDNITVAAPRLAPANLYFSVPAFVVLFRESLEVVIVLAIIMQFLTKMKNDGLLEVSLFYKFRREVYFGASLGFALCLLFGVGFLALASLTYQLFDGDNERIFQFCMMSLTCVVLTFLAVNFYKMMIYSKEAHERKMKRQMEETLEATQAATGGGEVAFGKKHAFFVLAFTTGLREGLESIVFLVGVISDVKDLSALPLPIISALVLARLVGCCFFQGTKGLKVDWFMRVSAVLLMCIAAGFFSASMHQLQELDVFGTWSPRSERPWQNVNVWDATVCCNDKTNRFFVLMRALFGWQDQATPVEIIAYILYWVAATIIVSLMVWHAKKKMQKMVEKWRLEDEEALKKSREEPTTIGHQAEDEKAEL